MMTSLDGSQSLLVQLKGSSLLGLPGIRIKKKNRPLDDGSARGNLETGIRSSSSLKEMLTPTRGTKERANPNGAGGAVCRNSRDNDSRPSITQPSSPLIPSSEHIRVLCSPSQSQRVHSPTLWSSRTSTSTSSSNGCCDE